MERLARAFVAEERRVLADERLDEVIADVVAAITGLGPVEALIADPDIVEIMVNAHDAIYVERDGRIERIPSSFDDDDHVRRVIDRILAPTGRRLDALSPMVDARLADGSRVNAIAPPLAANGTVMTIRRFISAARNFDDLQRLGAFDHACAQQLRDVVAGYANVIVAGATSTGKSTLLAACLALASCDDRLVSIEDSLELAIAHPHVVRLEARPAVPGGAPGVAVRDLVRNALRMRPDRLVVGEVRGEEAFDLLQALNTGHRGCWSTVHANGAEDALLRLESMAMFAGTGIPQPVVRAQIARAIDYVIFVCRDGAAQRRVASVSRVQEGANGWLLEEIWR